MPDVVSRSFCERCGTTHTLEPANRRRVPGAGALPIVARGLRNFILSDDSLGDALAQARAQHADSLTARQLATFERSFCFCMECRQYVCRDCWNDARGRCATCAPFPGAVVVAPPPASAAEPLPEPTAAEIPAEPIAAEPIAPEGGATSPGTLPPAETVADPYAWPFAYPLPPTPGFGALMPTTEAPASEFTSGATTYATCPSCTLALSRSARFCRRCGAPQLAARTGDVVAAQR